MIKVFMLWILLALSPLLGILRYVLINSEMNAVSLVKILSAMQVVYPFIVFILFSVLSIRFLMVDSTNQTKKLFSLIVISILSLTYAVGLDVLMAWGMSKYTNFLYSQYGLQPSSLVLLQILFSVIFVSYAAAVSILQRKDLVKIMGNTQEKLIFYITMFGLFLLAVQSLYPFTRLPTLIEERNQGYRESIGNDYVYVQRLQDQTPADSIIILPPQGGKWPVIGNQPLIRYFLFPRTLISGISLVREVSKGNITEAYFVALPGDASRPDWPLVNTEEKVVIFDEENTLPYKTLEKVDNQDVYSIIF